MSHQATDQQCAAFGEQREGGGGWADLPVSGQLENILVLLRNTLAYLHHCMHMISPLSVFHVVLFVYHIVHMRNKRESQPVVTAVPPADRPVVDTLRDALATGAPPTPGGAYGREHTHVHLLLPSRKLSRYLENGRWPLVYLLAVGAAAYCCACGFETLFDGPERGVGQLQSRRRKKRSSSRNSSPAQVCDHNRWPWWFAAMLLEWTVENWEQDGANPCSVLHRTSALLLAS